MSELFVVTQALTSLPESEVFGFFLKLAAGNTAEGMVTAIDQLKSGSATAELRAKIDTEFLVKATIAAAKKPQKNDFALGQMQTMLRVAAALIRKSANGHNRATLTDVSIAQYGLQIFSLLQIGEDDKGLAQGLVRDCGRNLSRENLELIIAKISDFVPDEKRAVKARNLLAEGYLGHNSAYSALVALWNDPVLSLVTGLTPNYEIIKILKDALGVVQVDDAVSVARARALFLQACNFPGIKEAKDAVMEARPDLVGELD